jgi:uncharacterized repeat protein (TIGR03943 family)
VVVVRRDAQGVVLLLLSVVIFRVTLGGSYVYYVKEAMKPLLLASATLLLILGAVSVWQVWRGQEEHDDGHGHAGLSRAAWLIVLPVLVVFVVAPRPLGAFTAARQLASGPVVVQPAELLPLPPGDPVDLPISDYITRADWGQGTTLRDREVRLTGFVMPNPEGGWWVTRLGLSCCAADALSWRVKVIGAPELPADTWVEVTGRWVAMGEGQEPAIEATGVVQIEQPNNPYE